MEEVTAAIGFGERGDVSAPSRTASSLITGTPTGASWNPCVGCDRALDAPTPAEETHMLQTVAIILIVLWALGMGTGYALGGLIHILLVVALISLILRFASGRKVV